MKKIIALLAVCVMLFSLVACVKPKVDPNATTTPNSTSESPSTVDENGYLLDDLSPSLNFNGNKVGILYWNDVEHTEFEVKEITGELVEDAIFSRNIAVENRLNIKLNYYGIPGNVSNIGSFVSYVQNTISADEKSYDIIGSYSSTGGTLAYNGFVKDLLELENLNFSQPWWPEELISTSTMNGHLYFCSGDISTNLLHMMYATFFNKDYLSTYSLDDPYALVESGKWTFEAFEKMSEGIYGDLNGDSIKNDTDRYGYATYWLHLDGLFGSVGIKSVEKDANDLLIISPSYGNVKTQSFLEYLNSRFAQSNDWYYMGNSGAAGKMQQTIFAEGRSLFMTERVRVCQNVLRFSETNYGILPIPKYDEAQKDYITTMAMPFTMYTVPENVADGERAGAVLECLASEGYRKVTPALFEIAMKTRYSSDDVSSKMYDIVRANITFDLGRLFNESIGKIPTATLRNMVQSGSSTWISKYKSLEKSLNSYIGNINTALEGKD